MNDPSFGKTDLELEELKKEVDLKDENFRGLMSALTPSSP